ncbi:mucin-12 [Biomphalaria glabrata]|nr:mucin-12 [Biomphalaria glabrata]
MAEIRIPTDQIPADILQRLQAMIPQIHFSGGQSQPNDNFIPAKGIAPSQHSPPSARPASFSKSRSFNRTSPDKNRSANHEEDEVDGNDSIVHACTIQPAALAAPDVMDDSDIVRIFPLMNDCKPKSKNSADVVRIFENGPDGVQRFANTTGNVRIDEDGNKGQQRETCTNSDIVRVMSPVVHRDFVHVNSKSDLGKSCLPSDSLRNVKSSASWSESNPPQRERIKQKSTSNRRHSNSVLANPDTTYRKTQTPCPKLDKGGQGPSHMFYLPHTAMSREGPASTTIPLVTDHEKSRSHQNYSDTNIAVQMNEDNDIEDDEVFSIDMRSKQCISETLKPISNETYQKMYETTPVRDLYVSHEPIKSRISPFNTAKVMSEISFGDRQNTRKRLSFDESETSPFKFPSHVAQQVMQSIVSSSAASTVCSLPSTSSASRISSPSTFSQRQILAHPYGHCGAQDFEFTYSSPPIQERYPKSMGNPASTACGLTVSEIMQKLEQVSSKLAQVSGGSRARIRSDGDENSSESRTHAQLPPARTRGQTFSHGKRRRLDSSFSGDDEDHFSSNQLPNSQDQPDEALEDCQCSAIENHILQVAEQAYKSIRRMDGSVEDFERFRIELASTNTLLKESIANIFNLKTICQHKSRSSSSSSSSSLQTRPS